VFLQNYRGPGIIEFKGIIFLLKIPWNMSTVSWTECTTMGSTSSWIKSLLRSSTAHSVCWLATAANTNGAIGGAHRRWLLSATVHYPRWFFSLQTRHKMGNLPRGSSGGGVTGVGHAMVAPLLQASSMTPRFYKARPMMRSTQTDSPSFPQAHRGVLLA
jgi:hypothetical protein